MRKIANWIIAGLMITSCVNEKNRIEFKAVQHIYNSASPAILSLQRMNDEDKRGTISKLMEVGEDGGFPLIERDTLYSDYVHATFIYIDTTHKHEIECKVSGILDEPRFGDQKLYQLDSSDLYYRTYMVPDDVCFAYVFALTDKTTGDREFVTDPFNKELMPKGERKSFSWSILDLTTNGTDWNSKKYDIDSRLDTFQISSDLLDNTRDIYVYLPADYENRDDKYPIIYLFDSFSYLNRVEVPNILDNLIYEGKLDPMIAVFIDNPSGTSRKNELPMNPVFKDFIISELIPLIKSKYRITDNSHETIIGGMSYGGLAATYIAFECDSIFGRVLSHSGSFWRDTVLTDNYNTWIRNDYLVKRFQKEGKKDLKIYLDWGLQEEWCKDSGRRLAQALSAEEYDYRFFEFNGWHDLSNARKTFPEALMYLTGNQ
ncbi:MAG: alpha/beta hydrolase-fold protein [Bacteroidota bacterium]